MVDAVGQEVNIGDLVVLRQLSQYHAAVVTAILTNGVDTARPKVSRIDGRRPTPEALLTVHRNRQFRITLAKKKISHDQYIKVPTEMYRTGRMQFDPYWLRLDEDAKAHARELQNRAYEFLLMNRGNTKITLPKDFQ